MITKTANLITGAERATGSNAAKYGDDIIRLVTTLAKRKLLPKDPEPFNTENSMITKAAELFSDYPSKLKQVSKSLDFLPDDAHRADALKTIVQQKAKEKPASWRATAGAGGALGAGFGALMGSASGRGYPGPRLGHGMIGAAGSALAGMGIGAAIKGLDHLNIDDAKNDLKELTGDPSGLPAYIARKRAEARDSLYDEQADCIASRSAMYAKLLKGTTESNPGDNG